MWQTFDIWINVFFFYVVKCQTRDAQHMMRIVYFLCYLFGQRNAILQIYFSQHTKDKSTSDTRTVVTDPWSNHFHLTRTCHALFSIALCTCDSPPSLSPERFPPETAKLKKHSQSHTQLNQGSTTQPLDSNSIKASPFFWLGSVKGRHRDFYESLEVVVVVRDGVDNGYGAGVHSQVLVEIILQGPVQMAGSYRTAFQFG